TRAPGQHDRRPQDVVANADQMLIVASVAQPMVKWGLVDRMLVAAQSGGLSPVICLNKIDLAEQHERWQEQFVHAQEVLQHYGSMGIATVQTCACQKVGVERVGELLKGKTTVLAGH